MNIITIVISIVLSLFSTIVMSYVSLATPIGPWIAPTLVFIALLCSKIVTKMSTSSLSYAVCAGSIGGILATASAFSFPTIYFLDPALFATWMSSPLFFSALLGCFSFLAGMFGMLIADLSEKTLIDTQNLSFPIGQLVHKMIAAQNQVRKAYELIMGFVLAALFSFLQGGFFLKYAVIPKSIVLLSPLKWAIFSLPRMVINLDIAPMIWAIGFVTGHVIALPLAVGAGANIVFLYPLQKLCFSYLSSTEFTLAFCSGVVFFITAMSCLTLPKQIVDGARNSIKRMKTKNALIINFFRIHDVILCLIIIVGFVLFLSYFKFPWYVQLYLAICSVITTYQIAAIAGRIGLALLGRFATFVMVPAMLMFNINYMHMVFIATFIEMSGGVAADVLFGRKLAQLSDISRVKMRQYQLLGLVIASLSIG
ncbi:MAG TPA: hypothetical protein VLB80_03715, partial [Candidatus Babeliales bacterium]|nr:hypothetical protein [Candidatus Babeliales bacterium]